MNTIVNAQELDQSPTTQAQTKATDQKTGISALGIDGSGIIFQIINFLILYYLLNRFLFKPIIKILDERQKKINDANLYIKQTNKEKANWDKMQEQAIKKAKDKTNIILQEAKLNADMQSKKIIQKASDEANRATKRAVAEIALQKDKMIKEAKKELIDLAVAITEKSLKGKIDRQTNVKYLKNNL